MIVASLAPGFVSQKGLVRKQFIWSENGTAGGVYQWDTLADANAFYEGPWLDGILSRYGCYPEIEYFTTFAVAQNPGGEVIYTEPPVSARVPELASHFVALARQLYAPLLRPASDTVKKPLASVVCDG